MSSIFYDSSGKDVEDGQIIQALDLNTINTSVDTAFELVESSFSSVDDEIALIQEDIEQLSVDTDPFILGNEEKTASFTAAFNYRYFVNTTSGVINVTLPTNPVYGDSIYFIDIGNNLSTNNLVIKYNGVHSIMGLTEDLIVDINYVSFAITFKDGVVKSWRVS